MLSGAPSTRYSIGYFIWVTMAAYSGFCCLTSISHEFITNKWKTSRSCAATKELQRDARSGVNILHPNDAYTALPV